MDSFYGGKNGQSFYVKAIFTTKNGATDSIKYDLSLGWTSPITENEFVIISYGLADTEEAQKVYDTYKQIDFDAEGRSYNATLWLKCFDETKGNASGWYYKLVASIAGVTPKFTIDQPIVILNADEDPKVWMDSRDPTRPILFFALPQSQIIALNEPINVIHADEDPKVVHDLGSKDAQGNLVPGPYKGTINKPTLTMWLPRSQVLSLNQPINVLDADQKPRVVFDEGSKDSLGNLVPGTYNGTVDKPTLTMWLPQSQVIEKAVIEEYLNVGQKPEVRLDLTTDGTVNRPVLKLKLPVSQRFLESNVSSLVLDANILPYIKFDDTDVNEPTLVFYLPQSQRLLTKNVSDHVLDADKSPYIVFNDSDINEPSLDFYLPLSLVMDDPETTVVDPMVDPNVSDVGTVNSPKLHFDLPRAIRFYYGSLLGERSAGSYTLTNPAFVDYGVGDYYINVATGFIYKVSIKSNGTTCVFEYVACILSPLPTIKSEGMSPYTKDLQPATPTVEREFLNSEETAWALKFKLPKAPIPDLTYDFIGPLEEGEADVSVTDEDTITFDFKIPTGSKIYSGLEVDTGKYDAHIEGARPGDLFLNSETGKVYELNTAMIWEVQEGSLKGPVGDALNIVAEYRLLETDDFVDSVANGVTEILKKYPDPQPEEIFAVTWIDLEGKETSYWYYKSKDGEWGRVQLTGGIGNIIKREYHPKDEDDDVDIDNTTYSIRYINSLIGGNLDLDWDKTAFSKNLIFGLLSWGTFDEAKEPSPIPEPDGHDTLSVEEVIELMSWGSITKLMLNN